MRRSSRRICLSLIVTLLASAAVAQGASASARPQSGSGTLYLSPPQELLWSRQIGPDHLASESGTLKFTGGTIVGTGTITVTAFIPPSGAETYVATWSSTATVNGRSGTLSMFFQGTDNGQYAGHFVALGSGGLAGLRGYGAYSGMDQTGTGTYTVQFTD